jgi:hypothetical protein
MTYTIAKVGDVWHLIHDGHVTGKYATKKAAVLTARILAGWRGTVTVVKKA